MKNMLGDEVEPRKLTFEWLVPHLNIYVNGHWQGQVSPNGWQGYSIDIHHKLGEPIMNNLNLWHSLSFTEMQSIMSAYNERLCPARAMTIVIGAVAEEKKISFERALKLLRDRNISFYSDPKGDLI